MCRLYKLGEMFLDDSHCKSPTSEWRGDRGTFQHILHMVYKPNCIIRVKYIYGFLSLLAKAELTSFLIRKTLGPIS